MKNYFNIFDKNVKNEELCIKVQFMIFDLKIKSNLE